MKKLATVLCLLLIAISFCACGNKATNIIEDRFDLKIPKGASAEYYYRRKPSHWLDYYPGFHYAVYTLKEEPSELLESYEFVAKPAGAEVTNSVVTNIDNTKKLIEQSIPAEYRPNWDTYFLAAKNPCMLYFPYSQTLIFYFDY